MMEIQELEEEPIGGARGHSGRSYAGCHVIRLCIGHVIWLCMSLSRSCDMVVYVIE